MKILFVTMFLLFPSVCASADIPDVSAADHAEGLTNPAVAINLGGICDWSTEMPFIDVARMMRPWAAPMSDGTTLSYDDLKAAGYLDANGYVMHMPPGAITVQGGWAWTDPAATASRAGVYVLTYAGKGELNIIWDGTVISREAGRIVFRANGTGNMALQILQTDPDGTGDYVRDISVVREDLLELHEAGAIFNPAWIERVKDFRQMRMMDWMGTNAPTIREWDDRPKLQDITWSRQGAPVEVMVRLANEVGADPWFCMSHIASPDYIRHFATYVRDHLDPKLKAYVEFSNEVWNWGFQATHDLETERIATWGGGWLSEYVVKRATETALIWQDVYGSEAETRLVKVLSGQTVNTWMTGIMFNPTAWFHYEPDKAMRPADVFDAFAITTYFGSSITSSEAERAALYAAINDPGIDANQYLYDRLMDPTLNLSVPSTSTYLREQRALAAAQGLDLILYEGGQHLHQFIGGDATVASALGEFLIPFVRSTWMADLYRQSIAEWATTVDGPYMQFVDFGTPNPWGSWGIWRSLDDVTPRGDVLLEANRTRPVTWEDRGGSHFQNGVISVGTSSGETLIGTTQEDYLIGADGDDVLLGGKGDDGLHGGDGTDVAVFSGSPGDYISSAEGGGVRVTGPDDSDLLVSIEFVQFESGDRMSMGDFMSFTPPPTPPSPGDPPANLGTGDGGGCGAGGSAGLLALVGLLAGLRSRRRHQ